MPFSSAANEDSVERPSIGSAMAAHDPKPSYASQAFLEKHITYETPMACVLHVGSNQLRGGGLAIYLP